MQRSTCKTDPLGTLLKPNIPFQQLTFFSMPLKNWNMVMLAGGFDMPSTRQIAFSSWNTGLPDSCAFFWGLLTKIILDASSSDTRKAGKKRKKSCDHFCSSFELQLSKHRFFKPKHILWWNSYLNHKIWQSSSGGVVLRSSRQSSLLRNLWVMSPMMRTEYGQASSDSRPLISSWKLSASLGPGDKDKHTKRGTAWPLMNSSPMNSSLTVGGVNVLLQLAVQLELGDNPGTELGVLRGGCSSLNSTLQSTILQEGALVPADTATYTSHQNHHEQHPPPQWGLEW